MSGVPLLSRLAVSFAKVKPQVQQKSKGSQVKSNALVAAYS